MIAIIALGNPGTKYEDTRHNAGRAILNFWMHGHDLPEPKLNKKLNCFLAQTNLHERKIIYGWPDSYMNESGPAISLLAKHYRLKPEQIFILHDDIDITLGTMKFAENRGAAGHHGVESIIEALTTKNFKRFRIGIQPIGGKPGDGEKFVLKKFEEEERIIFTEAMPQFAIEIDQKLIQ